MVNESGAPTRSSTYGTTVRPHCAIATFVKLSLERSRISVNYETHNIESHYADNIQMYLVSPELTKLTVIRLYSQQTQTFNRAYNN